MGKRRLIITGVDGFVGHHVARIASADGFAVTGIARAPKMNPTLSGSLAAYVSCDLRDEWPENVTGAPIVHLAGLAAVGPSFEHPQRYISDNSAMVTNMCEAMVRAHSPERVVIVSTGAVYATHLRTTVRSELDPTSATSPYVVSKLLVESQASYYRRRGIDAVVARPFNHIGPGQAPGFLVPDLLQRLLRLPAGQPLVAGNLATRRDYTDVRDVARAYLQLATAPSLAHDLYNVASGVARSGTEILETLCSVLGREVPMIAEDPSLARADDPSVIAGSAERLSSELGWSPRLSLRATLADTVAGM